MLYTSSRMNSGKKQKRDPNHGWFTPHEFRVVGMPSTGGSEGLLPPGVIETRHPVPREFDVSIVDADVAKIANKLVRIANAVPSGSNAAKSLIDTASFLSRLAALPVVLGICLNTSQSLTYQIVQGDLSTGITTLVLSASLNVTSELETTDQF